MKKTINEQSNYELKKQSEWYLTLSQVFIGSTAIKLLEPGNPAPGINTFITVIGGLFLALIFVRLGLSTARKVIE